MSHFVYILKCSDGSYYIGLSENPEERVKRHNSGRGAKYTFKRRPVKLVYTESHDNLTDAVRRETQIKKWSHAKKNALINGDMKILKLLAKRRIF